MFVFAADELEVVRWCVGTIIFEFSCSEKYGEDDREENNGPR